MFVARSDEFGANPRIDENLWMQVRSYRELGKTIASAEGRVRLVGIDGCGGAGKTTFATRLSDVLRDVSARAERDTPVIHTDDFASHDEPVEWWPTMLHDVIEPLLRNEPASYRPYDWVTRQRTDTVTVPPAPVILIEGVGATRAAWRDKLAMRIGRLPARPETATRHRTRRRRAARVLDVLDGRRR